MPSNFIDFRLPSSKSLKSSMVSATKSKLKQVKSQVETQVKHEVKQQINEISKEAVDKASDIVDIDVNGVSPSDLKKIVDNLRKGKVLEAASIAMDVAILAVTASVGGVGAIFGGAVVGLKHLFEAMVDEPSEDEITKRDLEAILNQFLYATLANIPDSEKELSGYRKAYKLNYPIVDSFNFLFGFLRTQFYEATLKSKGALPSATGIYPRQHKVEYRNSWKLYASVIRALFYKLFPYPQNRLIYPSKALVAKIKKEKNTAKKYALVPYNELWYWDDYWKTKDPGLKDRALGTSYSVFDNPPSFLKKTPLYPIINKKEADVIYSSETGLPITKTESTALKHPKEMILAKPSKKKKKKKKSKPKKKAKKKVKVKTKAKTKAKTPQVDTTAFLTSATQAAIEKTIAQVEKTITPEEAHEDFILWAALGLPYYV